MANANYLSSISITMWLVVILIIIFRLRQKSVAMCLVASVFFVILTNFVPFYHGFSMVQLFQGMFSDLSVATCIVFTIYWFKLVFKLKLTPVDQYTAIVLVILGLALYLTTLDILPFDLYDLGYYPHFSLVVLILLMLLFWSLNKIFAWVWLLALCGFYFKIQASSNLWDYLIDPVLWLNVIILGIMQYFKGKEIKVEHNQFQ